MFRMEVRPLSVNYPLYRHALEAMDNAKCCYSGGWVLFRLEIRPLSVNYPLYRHASCGEEQWIQGFKIKSRI